MDPVIELATVTVSYVWTWRELFPATERLTAETRLSADLITTHRNVDMAVYAKMRDLTLRQADERVVPASPGDEPSPSVDSPGMAEFVRLLASERATAGAVAGGTRVERVRQKLDTIFNASATRDDLTSAEARIAQRYVSDLRASLGVIGSIDVNGGTSDGGSGTGSGQNVAGPVSRERLTTMIARAILERRQAAALAAALNYRPLLLRDVDADLTVVDDELYPRQLATRCRARGVPLPFALVLHEELDEIERSRALRGGERPTFGRRSLALDRAAEQGHWAILEPRSYLPLGLTILFILTAFLLARRIDVNESSMHHFYRNRLVRAYLGASRSPRHRSPNAFTGLDLDDDVKLWRFQTRDPSTENDASSDCRRGFVGPFPIINATLNTSGGGDLAWRERKGQSFVFTPLYSGFDFAVKQAALPERTRSQFAYQGDEPIDVLEYKRRSPGFPHQSTADQWFDERQFESYRVLGLHIAGVTMSTWPTGAIGFSGRENASAFDAVARNIDRLRWTAQVARG